MEAGAGIASLRCWSRRRFARHHDNGNGANRRDKQHLLWLQMLGHEVNERP
jgi:hypothetical protein